MAITIRALHTLKERKEFVALQWKFYHDDRYWVPPLHFDRLKLLDTVKNPFYKHAEMQLFIADQDGEPVGRIAAIVNHSHNEVHQDRVGFFGFFESINSPSVAAALFDAAAAWLKERGMQVMRGPMNPSVNDEIGLLVDGWNGPPRILMTYNPRYYAVLVEQAGFTKVKDLYAYQIERSKVPMERLEKVSSLLAERYSLRARELDFSRVKQEMAIVKHLYNVAWEKNWGAVAMNDEEFDFLAADLTQVLGKKFRDLVFIVEKGDEPIGFALCLPDINRILIENKKGRLIPGAFRLLTQSRKIDWARIIVLGVLPEWRGKGIDGFMYHQIIRRAEAHGIYYGEASWVLEDNVMMNRGADMLASERYRTYRLYDKKLH